MLYISGLHALNLPCALDTTGDWHTSALNWKNIKFVNSENSIFGDYGIEQDKIVPEHEGTYNVANHIRAILDLISKKRFDLVSNFNNDFICNDVYTNEIFEKVALLLPDNEIYNFMYKTYGRIWKKWIGEYNTEK